MVHVESEGIVVRRLFGDLVGSDGGYKLRGEFRCARHGCVRILVRDVDLDRDVCETARGTSRKRQREESTGEIPGVRVWIYGCRRFRRSERLGGKRERVLPRRRQRVAGRPVHDLRVLDRVVGFR